MRIKQAQDTSAIANLASEATGNNDSGEQTLSMDDINDILIAANSQIEDCAPNQNQNADPNLNYRCQRVTTPNTETIYETYSDDGGNVVSSLVTTNSIITNVDPTDGTDAQSADDDGSNDNQDDDSSGERIQTNQESTDDSSSNDQTDTDTTDEDTAENSDQNQEEESNNNDDSRNAENEEDNNQDDSDDSNDEDPPSPNESRCLQNVNSCLMITENVPVDWEMYYECYNNALQSAYCQSGFGE
ncbi:unnamed protein product [Moneuplotes crassus]|uniref:Uncharacterized protein n=1 Tax=Euplotes crassus TaxID=5936 RepID=A0AAD2D3B0_EUPCR|nr:unnamed protein product [Moneuplotes crassus]